MSVKNILNKDIIERDKLGVRYTRMKEKHV